MRGGSSKKPAGLGQSKQHSIVCMGPLQVADALQSWACAVAVQCTGGKNKKKEQHWEGRQKLVPIDGKEEVVWQ